MRRSDVATDIFEMVSLNETPSLLTMRSCAKINVFLEVLGRRDDGFHQLETVMLKTQLHDSLSFRLLPAGEIRIRIDPATPAALRNSFPLDDSNLIVRVAGDLQKYVGQSSGADLPGAEITVLKRIPAEAGLAGGSSNAATTIRALNFLWGLNLSAEDQHRVAAAQGSDINFLLSGARAAVCRGRGEIVEPLRLRRRFWFVAVRPQQGNSTREVFRRVRFPRQPLSAASAAACLSGQSARSLQDCCFNRLTTAAAELNPQMRHLLDWLPRRLNRPAFMSGSGSTCFVVAQNLRDAGRVHAILRSVIGLPSWILEC